MEKMVTVFGGDGRYARTAQILTERGYTVTTWGTGGEIPEEQKLSDWKQGTKSPIWLLPLPVSREGVYVNQPDGAKERLRLSSLLPYCEGKRILGGIFPEPFAEKLREKGASLKDFWEDESLQLRNAAVTAEGAIYLAMKELPRTLFGMRAAVLGYGRIGRSLARKLSALGAKVTVCARRREVLTAAELEGFESAKLNPDAGSEEGATVLPPEILGGIGLWFNTVPAVLFGKNELARLPGKPLLIELSSLPGGFDLPAAREAGIPILFGSSLPGKYAPESAGEILAEAVTDLLGEEERE